MKVGIGCDPANNSTVISVLSRVGANVISTSVGGR